MKRTLYFSLLMISLLVTYTTVAQEDFRNTELVNTVFNALKTQSEIKAIENFKDISKRGNSFGVLWKDIILEKVSYKSNPDHNVPIERGSITMECSSNDKKFLIVLKKSYKIQDTWRVMDPIKFTLL